MSVQPITVFEGDCLTWMPLLPAGSVAAIVTDPPYGLGFMGKEWDDLPPGREWAEECLRVLKPGGHLLAFGGTRTWHRLAVAIEDAGFEVRDSIAWLYGSGFPKSMDVSKAIDAKLTTGKSNSRAIRAASDAREVVGTNPNGRRQGLMREAAITHGYKTEATTVRGTDLDITAPATPEAEQWQGWGTALKPAFEPIVVARKPFRGTVAANVLEHGTGALNIDGCRIGAEERTNHAGGSSSINRVSRVEQGYRPSVGEWETNDPTTVTGRWPANVVLDEDQAAALDEQSGITRSSKPSETVEYGARIDTGGNKVLGRGLSSSTPNRPPFGDSGGASRFFYVAKAPKKERPVVDGVAHPTVKPLTLMRWLVRLVTPPGGFVLDPFAGSGTTGEAAVLEGFKAILIEREPDYLRLIQARIDRLPQTEGASA